MNCNQVFNILTRGPFPSGESTDGAVELHLATCGSCRQLAEALRPALEVLQEAVAPEECGSLPGYWGELAPAPADRAVSTAARVGPARRRRRRLKAPATIARDLSSVSPWQFVVAVAFGLLLGLTLRSAPWFGSATPADTKPGKTPVVESRTLGGQSADVGGAHREK